jgi:hypothetical protein
MTMCKIKTAFNRLFAVIITPVGSISGMLSIGNAEKPQGGKWNILKRRKNATAV